MSPCLILLFFVSSKSSFLREESFVEDQLKMYFKKWSNERNLVTVGLLDRASHECDHNLATSARILRQPRTINVIDSKVAEYFLFLPNLETIEAAVADWNDQKRIHFVICDLVTAPNLTDIFEAIWRRGILNYVTVYVTDTLHAVVYDPFRKAVSEVGLDYFPNRLKDVVGYEIRVAMFENFPAMRKIDGNWVGKDYQFLRLIEEAMNASFKIVETSSKTQFVGLREALRQGVVDVSFMGLFGSSDFEDVEHLYPLIVDGAVVVLPKEETAIVDITEVLDPRIWRLLALVALVLTALAKLTRRNFHTWKYLSLVAITVPGLFSNIFQCGFSSTLTKMKYEKEINTIEDLRASNLPLVTFGRFANILTANNITLKTLQIISKNRMIAMLSAGVVDRGYVMPFVVALEFVKNSSQFRIMKEFLVPGQRVYLFRKNSPYIEEVRDVFLRLREAGLVAKIARQNVRHKEVERKKTVRLRIEHLRASLVILLSGCVLSSVVFIWELWRKKRRVAGLRRGEKWQEVKRKWKKKTLNFLQRLKKCLNKN